jgi:hypothetical protein
MELGTVGPNSPDFMARIMASAGRDDGAGRRHGLGRRSAVLTVTVEIRGLNLAFARLRSRELSEAGCRGPERMSSIPGLGPAVGTHCTDCRARICVGCSWRLVACAAASISHIQSNGSVLIHIEESNSLLWTTRSTFGCNTTALGDPCMLSGTYNRRHP